MTATNAATVQSNPVTVTARAASSWTRQQGPRTGQIPKIDTPFTYRVGITLAAGGTQPINNARFVDTLPPGASSCPPASGGTFNAGQQHRHVEPRHADPQANTNVTVHPRRHRHLPLAPVPSRRPPQQHRRGLRRARG